MNPAGAEPSERFALSNIHEIPCLARRAGLFGLWTVPHFEIAILVISTATKGGKGEKGGRGRGDSETMTEVEEEDEEEGEEDEVEKGVRSTSTAKNIFLHC